MTVGGSCSRILLVDDDQIILDALSYGLRDAGYSVETCTDAAQALSLYQNAPPDLAILDIGLPDMRGTALAKSLLSYRYRPILILSSHTEPEWVHRAIGSGVIGYLVKPLSVPQLVPSIETALVRFGDITQRVASNFGGRNMNDEQLIAVLNQFSFGIVIIDGDHHIVRSNLLADKLMASKRLLLNREGKLRSAKDNKAFLATLNQSLGIGGDPKPSAISLPDPDTKTSIQLWGTPLPGVSEDSEKSAIVAIDDPSLTTIAPASLLKTLYRFTDKEYDLAHALTDGVTINQYCEKVFISPNTARTHLKSVYRKTGTNRQPDLIRLLSGLFINLPDK